MRSPTWTMELHCLHPESPTTTTTTASACSCSTDPPYDNCPPFAQRLREREVESRLACPAVTGPLGPCSPPPALAPAAVPTVVSGGRGGGAGPDHCYCSWRGGPLGGPGWEEAVLDAEMTKRGGGGGGAESCWAAGVRARENQSPEPSQSEQHRSALSLYDNIPAAAAATATPDDLSFLEASRVPTEHTAWPPEPIRTSMDVDEGLTDDQSTWSSCEIILTECNFRGELEDAGQDRSDEQEPELDYGFNRGGSLSPSPQQQPSPAGLPHQQPWSPRVPPPVPLADPSASALRSVLTSLQQQIVRQREEYEARILR